MILCVFYIRFIDMKSRCTQEARLKGACSHPLFRRPCLSLYLWYNKRLCSKQGPVAQGLEQGTHNPLVVGSKPTGPTIKPRNDWRSRGFFIFVAAFLWYPFKKIRYSEMQEKVTQNCILQRRRLGCQTQRFRRLVDLLGFQPNLPAVSLFYAFHYNKAASRRQYT